MARREREREEKTQKKEGRFRSGEEGEGKGKEIIIGKKKETRRVGNRGFEYRVT